MSKETFKFMMEEGATPPTKGHKGDFGTDLYLAEDALLVPGTLKAKLIGTGLHTEFDPNKAGLLVVPRSSTSLIPISMANHIGVVEGTYRGEIKVPLRNTIPRDVTDTDTFNYVLEWNESTKELTKTPGDKVPKHLWEEMVEEVASDLETYLLGERLEEDAIKEGAFIRGSILFRKGTRIAQAFLTPKVQSEWVAVSELSKTERGEGGFGSTNNK